MKIIALGLMTVLAGRLTAAERPIRAITLLDCQRIALEQNLQLKIQRINPEMARLTLRAAHGIYDPVFYSEVRRENLADSGGYDPADFSKDAVYTAESHTASLGLTGLTPMGLSYAINGDYANSFGQRNFMYFDSFNINAGLTLSQPLLRDFWIDQGRMNIQVSRKQVKISELGVAYAAMDVLSQLQQAYYELMFARENLVVQEELLAMRERFRQGVQRQVQGGLLTAPDESLALAQVAEANSAVAEAQNAEDLAENTLRLLLGESFTNQLTSALKPTEQLAAIAQLFDFSQSWKSGLEQRPDLVWLRTEAEKAEIDLKYRYNQLFPTLNLIAGWGRRGANTVQSFLDPPTASSGPAFDQLRGATAPNDMVGLVFSIPLSRTAERANYRLSKQVKEQARLMVRQKEELVMREVSDAIVSAQAGLRRVDATRQAARHAQAVLQAEEKKLAGGKSTVFFVLQFQSALALARSAELRARADYNQACARLRLAEGSILEASGFVLKTK